MSETETLVVCEFQLGTFECRGDGFIWDADDDGYDPNDKSMPCPCCNTNTFLENAKEKAESTSYWSSAEGHGNGVDIWRGAVAGASYWNDEATKSALKNIGKVAALKADDEGEDCPSVEVFEYT